MSTTYSTHAAICAKFYSLSLDPDTTADFVFSKSQAKQGEHCLFVGSMFDIAENLVKLGLSLTLVDYSSEMVTLGKQRFPNLKVMQADLRNLPFNDEFDLIFVIGRVFTHMTESSDLRNAIESCHRSLHSSARIFVDNYQDSLIQRTSYFNGTLSFADEESLIARTSTTKLLQISPTIVNWTATYKGHFKGDPFEFSDSMPHRAFSRAEFAQCLESGHFKVTEQGDNFDETSFYTLAQKAHS